MPPHRKYILSCLALIIVAMLSITGFYITTTQKNQVHPPNTIPSKSSPHRYEIKKLDFNRVVCGEKTLSFSMDRFSIQKSKIGFLRIALANEVHIENAHIEIYDTDVLFADARRKKRRIGMPKSENPNLARTAGYRSEKDPQLINLLSEISSSLIPAKRITKIVCYPMRVDLYAAGTIRTSIDAGSATLNDKLQIVFKKNVKITSDGRKLTARRIIFDPAKLTFYVKGSYILKNEKKETKGQRMKTDIWLNSLNG